MEDFVSLTESAPHPGPSATATVADPHAAHPPTDEEGPRKSWAVLAVALTAQILVVLDISVVNTALPSIGKALELHSGDLQWIVTAYLMMSGGALLLGGARRGSVLPSWGLPGGAFLPGGPIAALVSRRRVFLPGMPLFPGASLVPGFAPTAGGLIAPRPPQGLAAALLTPAALSLVM